MQNSDLKTWALMILLALGGVFQISKSLTPKVSRSTADVSAAFDREDQPYSVHADRHARAAVRPADDRLALDASAAATDGSDRVAKFLAENAPAVGTTFTEKAGEKKEDKCVKKIDPQTGKEICKKKKKKKTKTEETKEDVAVLKPKASSANPAHDSAGIEWGVASVVATNNLDVKGDKADRAFESAEAWRKRLLDTPNLAETKLFIDHFQRNLVTAEIFYQLTQEMMDDSRADMKLLGVMCASQNVSAISFQMLAELAEKERSGSSVRSQTDAALARYTDLTSLTVLANVMRSNTSTYPSLVAAQKLDVAAKRYLTVASTTNPTAPSATPPTTATTPKPTAAARNKTYFTRFVTILQTLAKSPDTNLRAQATASLTNLQMLLNQTPAVPTGPAADQPPTSVAAQ